MKLPPYITKLSDNWFFNTKSKRYIHKDNIEVVLKKYERLKTGNKAVVNARLKYKKELKLAKKRWEL